MPSPPNSGACILLRTTSRECSAAVSCGFAQPGQFSLRGRALRVSAALRRQRGRPCARALHGSKHPPVHPGRAARHGEAARRPAMFGYRARNATSLLYARPASRRRSSQPRRLTGLAPTIDGLVLAPPRPRSQSLSQPGYDAARGCTPPRSRGVADGRGENFNWPECHRCTSHDRCLERLTQV